jgi:hypothetical protein
MIPDLYLLTVALSFLVMAARFGRMAKSLLAQLFATNQIGSLRHGFKSQYPRQALPSSESK